MERGGGGKSINCCALCGASAREKERWNKISAENSEQKMDKNGCMDGKRDAHHAID